MTRKQVKGPKLRVGAHVSISGGLHKAISRGAEEGCDVIQIFTKSNQQWASKPIRDEDLELWQKQRERHEVQPSMAHNSYLINLAAQTAKLRDKSYRALSEKYRRCALLGVPNLIMHPGSHCGDGLEVGIARIAACLNRLFEEHSEDGPTILLENTAGQGTSIGHRFEHLRDILGKLNQPHRVGICIDTCHTLAAGYDIRTKETWNTTFEELDEIVGCDLVGAFHVNDSKKPLGSRVDRHEHLGRGFLGLSPFQCLVNDPRFVGLPMALETPKPTEHSDKINLAILRALHGRTRVTPTAKKFATRDHAEAL